MVGQLTTVWPVGMVVPKSDGVREEGSLVDLGSGKRYKVVESITSNRDYWYEIRLVVGTSTMAHYLVHHVTFACVLCS